MHDIFNRISSRFHSHTKKHAHRFAFATLAVLLIIANVFSYSGSAYAATYTFVQSSWSGGADTGLVAAHPGDASTWAKYYSVSGLTAGADVRLTSTSYAFTDDGATSTSPSANTKGGKFSDGTNSSTTLSGSGTAASIALTSTTVPADATSTYPLNAYSSPLGATFDPYTNSVWVANANNNNISKINPSTGAIIGTYSVGLLPEAAAYDSLTHSIWVSNHGASTVTKLSATDGSLIGTYNVGSAPLGIVFDSYTNSIWTANNGSANGVNGYTKLSAADGSLIGTYDAPSANPAYLTFDSSTNSVWASSASGASKINVSTGAVIGSYGGGAYAEQGITFDSSTNSIWMVWNNQNKVEKIRASDGAVLGTYVTGTAPYLTVFDSYTNSIWVSNYSDGTVSRLSAANGALIATYKVDFISGAGPIGLTYDSYTHSVWSVTYTGTGTITKITNISSQPNPSYTAGTSPQGVAFDSSTNSVWVANYTTGNVTKFNASTGAVTGTYTSGGNNPWAAAFDPSTNSVWVTNYGSGSVTKFNASDGSVTGTYATGNNPTGVAYDSSTGSMWISNYAGSVTKITAATGAVVGTYAMPGAEYNIAFDSYTNSIWVADYGTGNVDKVNPATGAVINSYAPSGGNSPISIAFDTSTNSLWVGDYTTGKITKINPSTGASIGSYTVATNRIYGLAFDSATNSIWASDFGGNAVVKVKASNGTKIASYAVGTQPFGVAYDSSTFSIWAANSGSTSATKITGIASGVYPASGTFTSAAIDLGVGVSFGTLTWTATLNGQTITMKARSSATSDFSGAPAFATCTNIASGAALSTGGCVTNGHQYIQYEATLSGDTAATPTLDSVTINYAIYSTTGTLVSSIYNSSSASNLISNVFWGATGTTTTEIIKFQVRSAATSGGIAAAAWCGPDDVTAPCSGTSYFTNNYGTTLPTGNPLKTGGDDQYFQYQVLFASNGTATPVLTSATIQYVVNATPEFDATYGTNGVSVAQNAGTVTNPGAIVISYKVRDTDTNSGTTNAGSISPTKQDSSSGFEYSLNGGSSWSTISTGDLGGSDLELKAVDTCSGGTNCTTYTTHTATWFATSTIPSTYNGTVEVRVTANDKEAANNLTTATSGTFALDTKVPVTYATLNASTGASTGTIILTTTDDSQTRYRFCNDSTFPSTDTEGNSCAWSSLAANLASSTVTTSWTPRRDAQNDEPVYLSVQDAVGNTTLLTVVAPATPPDFGFTDVSDPSATPSFYGELLKWTAFQATTSSAFASYVLYGSTDGVTYAPLTTITNSPTSNYLDTITSGTSLTHYYKVLATSAQGNTSAFSSVVSDVPNGYGGQIAPPDSAPVISNIATSTLATSAVITFTTDKLATSTIMYGTSAQSCSAYTNRHNTTAYVTAQSISLTDLLTSTSYYFCVQSTSVAGTTNTATSTTGTGAQLSFTTSSGPSITNVHLGATDDTIATVLWDTATSSDSYVYYSTNADLSNPLNAGTATSTQSGDVFSHQVVLTGLAINTAYYYYVKSTDSAGNVSTNTNSGVYYTIPAARNVTPPVISNISTPVQSSTAVAVLWQTDKNASSKVYYGTSSGTYPNITSLNSTLSIYHSTLLSSTTLNTIGGATDVSVSSNALTPETTYYFIAVSTDAAGNTATSSESSFSTATAPDITAPGISSISIPSSTLKSSSAVVTFTTDEVATSSVQYTVTGAGSWTTVNDDTLGLAHSVSLTNLTPNTSYTYQVRAGDAVGNTTAYTSAGSPTFQTPTGPTISGVTSSDVTATGALITWNTANSADSYVYYATTTSSGALVSPLTAGDATLVSVSGGLFAHRITLSSLTSSATYYFYVRSTDADANSATDNNSGSFYTFATALDVSPPVISDIAVPITTTSAAVITWTTDKNATSQVEYGTSAGETAGAYTYMTVLNSTPATLHVTTLAADTLNTNGGTNALTANTTYYYRVRSVSENGVSAESDEGTFSTTAQVTKGVTSTSSGTGSGTGTVQAATVLPSISAVTVDNIGAFNADVHVATNKNVVAFVHYGPTESYGSIEGEDVFSNTKTITLTKLQEGTTYHYRVVVYDSAGHTTASADQTFDTIFASEALKNLTRLQNASDIQGKLEQLIQSALPSLAPPFITAPDVTNITESAATITWKTNIKSYGALRYGTSAEYAAKGNDYQTEVTSSQAQESTHTVDLANLLPNTLYHFQARAYVFPQVVGTTTDMTFSTKAAPITANIVDVKNNGFSVVWQSNEPTTSVVEYTNRKTGDSNLITDSTPATYHNVPIINLPSGTSYTVRVSGINAAGNTVQAAAPLNVTTSIDVTPPVISNFKVDNALVPGNTGFIQTVVGWQTDKPANSIVYYEQGAGASASTTRELSSKVQTLDVYSTAHIVILPHLTAGTVYRIKVVSTDMSGNTKVFGPTSIITPNQTQSVLDIIVKNFENTFKFLGAKQ